MKKFKLLTGLTLLILTVLITGFTSCNNGRMEQLIHPSEELVDSATNISEPLGFTNCLEIVEYHDQLVQAYKEDSIFRSMSSELVTYVSAVLIKENKDNIITVSDIVQCYLGNRRVFDALHDITDEKILQINLTPTSAEVNDTVAKLFKTDTIPKKN